MTSCNACVVGNTHVVGNTDLLLRLAAEPRGAHSLQGRDRTLLQELSFLWHSWLPLLSNSLCLRGFSTLKYCYAPGKEDWLVLAFCASSSAGLVGVLGQELSYFTCAHNFVLQQPCHMLYPCNGYHIHTSETRVPQQQHVRRPLCARSARAETAVS